MASTTFIDTQTVIRASWLNDVNTATYTTIPAIVSSGASIVASSLNGGQLAGYRNKIINGDMRIDQRFGGGALVPVIVNSYVMDRLQYVCSQAGKYNFQRNANGLTPPDTFTNYAGFVLAVPFTPISTDFCAAVYRVEGYDMQEYGWGAVGARPITVSFLVRSAMTGAHSIAFANDGFTRTYPTTFNIPVANTWTLVAITVPGDTSGTWNKDSGIGLSIYFGMGMGSSFEGTNTAWNAGNKLRAVGAVNPSTGAASSNFALTGLQLEGGSVNTPFERRSYQAEFAMCQRYFQLFPPCFGAYAATTVNFNTATSWPVQMRAAPTATITGTASVTEIGGGLRTVSSVNGTLSVAGFVGNLGTAAAGSVGKLGNYEGSIVGAGIYLNAEL